MNLKSEIYTMRASNVKCATLELKPYGKTRETIEKKNLLAIDKEISNKVEKLKPLVDKYILYVIDKGLSITEGYDFTTAYNAWINEGEDRKAYEAICEEIKATALANVLAVTGYDKPNFLQTDKFYLSDKFLNWLGDMGEDTQAALDMKGLGTLLTNSFKWTQTALSIWMTNRVIENMEIYFANLPTVERIAKDDNKLREDIGELTCRYCLAENYAFCMSVEGISEYNKMISGENSAEGIVTPGIGIYVNEQNQKIRNENQKVPKYKKPKQLYKQILMPVAKAFTIDTIETNTEFLEVLGKDLLLAEKFAKDAMELFHSLDDEVSISGKNLHYLAAEIFSGKEHAELNELISKESGMKQKEISLSCFSTEYLSRISEDDINTLARQSAYTKAELLVKKIKAIQSADILSCKTIKESEDNIRLIVEMTDAVTDLMHYLRMFIHANLEENNFTASVINLYAEMKACTKATNLMRNFAVKSLKSEATKSLAMFGNSARLSGGWFNGEGKFDSRSYAIIRMDDKYYLAIIAGGDKPIDFKLAEKGEESVELHTAKKLQKMNLCIPATAFSPEVKKYFGEGNTIPYVLQKAMQKPVIITKDVWDIYNTKSANKAEAKKLGLSDEELEANKIKLLTLYRKIATQGTQFAKFDMESLKQPEEYKTIAEFNAEAEAKNIAMGWMNIRREQVETLVEDGKLLLFLITNKNMYLTERGRGEGLTSYAEIFLSIFCDENMKNTNLVLNAAPSLFYRPKLIEPKVTHPVGSILVNRKDIDGNHIPEQIHAELYHYHNGRLSKSEISKEAAAMIDKVGHSVAEEDIIKDERYTHEQFTITFSYTINKKATDETYYSLNKDADAMIKEGCNALVVARGTTDLLYYILYAPDGKVLEEGDLNSIDGTNYQQLLKEYTYLRRNDKAKLWKYDTKVAGIKDFYLKHAVGIIAKKAIENDAVIVMEKIPDRAREKFALIDHQLFGKIEDMLRNKLENYYIPHLEDKTAPGGRLNPLQLSYAFSGYNKGILKLFPNTFGNLVDLGTGFINVLDMYDLESAEKRRRFLAKFKEIKFTSDALTFTFDYNDMPLRSFERGDSKKPLVDIGQLKKTEWTVKAQGARSVYDAKNKKTYNVDDIANETLKIMIAEGSNTGGNLVDDIDNLSKVSVSAIYDAFASTVNPTLRASEDNEECRFSPITGETYFSVARYKAMTIYSRFIFRYNNEEGNKDNELEAWINTLIK